MWRRFVVVVLGATGGRVVSDETRRGTTGTKPANQAASVKLPATLQYQGRDDDDDDEEGT